MALENAQNALEAVQQASGCDRLLESVLYNKMTIDLNTIQSAFVSCEKNKNDASNKLRESIIGAVINGLVPEVFYLKCEKWKKLKDEVEKFISEISQVQKDDIKSISCVQKGGRKFNYDYDVFVNDTRFKVEFKFNANRLSDAPQFVSPVKPSLYLSANYEEFFYENYFKKLAMQFHLSVPLKEDYYSQIHSTEPKCLEQHQRKYYMGCKTSSKYSGDNSDIEFYKEAKKAAKESIERFIESADLDCEKLSLYLSNSQENKVYLFYKDGKISSFKEISSKVLITECKKDAKKHSYILTTSEGKKIKVLLRWKNGNGIAFPAFQIK
jgi:hypothetical protein